MTHFYYYCFLLIVSCLFLSLLLLLLLHSFDVMLPILEYSRFVTVTVVVNQVNRFHENFFWSFVQCLVALVFNDVCGMFGFLFLLVLFPLWIAYLFISFFLPPQMCLNLHSYFHAYYLSKNYTLIYYYIFKVNKKDILSVSWSVCRFWYIHKHNHSLYP